MAASAAGMALFRCSNANTLTSFLSDYNIQQQADTSACAAGIRSNVYKPGLSVRGTREGDFIYLVELAIMNVWHVICSILLYQRS